MRSALFLLLLLYCFLQAALPPLMQALPPPSVPVPTHPGLTPEKFQALTTNGILQAKHTLRGFLLTQYESMADGLDRDLEQRRERTRAWGQRVFRIGTWLSLLVLLIPLLRWRHYKGRRRVLVLSSIFGAALFALGIAALGGMFGILNDISHGVASELDPKRAMLDAGFELLLDRTVPLLVEGRVPWADVVSDTPTVNASTGLSERLFQNLSVLHAYAFEPVAKMYRLWRGWAAIIPLALVIATALLFLLSVRPVLHDLITLPERAASGQRHALRGAVRTLLGTVWKEFLAIVVLFISVGFLSGALAVAMRQLTRPAMRVLVGQTEAAMQWLSVADPEFNLGVTVGMSSLPILLLACISLMAFGSVLWMFRARRICRARFHERISLRAHDRFWRTTAWALLKLHWIPIIFLTLTAPAILHVVSAQDVDTAPARLLGSAVLLVAGTIATFWFFRGTDALRTLWNATVRVRSEPDEPAEEARAPTGNSSD